MAKSVNVGRGKVSKRTGGKMMFGWVERLEFGMAVCFHLVSECL